MEMRQVHYFLALCEEETFTQAAKRCGVSQPSLTNGIKQLEAEIGGSLFHRGGRQKIKLTLLGAAVRPYLEQIVRSVEKANHKAGALARLNWPHRRKMIPR